MQTATQVIIESVFYEGERGWMAEVRSDGHPIATYGPYADRADAELWSREIGRRCAEFAEKEKARIAEYLDNRS